MSDSLDLAGIITGTVTPFDSKDRIDWSALERHLDGLKSTGIKGLLANAMMAEGIHLTRPEREACLEFITRNVGSLPVIATIFGINTSEAADEAYRAAQLGAQALLVYPHPAFGGEPLNADIPVGYYRAIHERAGIPVIVFRAPAAAAPLIGLGVLKRLADVRGILGFKDSVADASLYEGPGTAFLSPDSPFKVFIDSDPVMLEYVRRGAYGAMSLCGTVVPDLYVHLFENAHTSGIEVLAEKLLPFANIIFRAPKRDFRARLKEALRQFGVLEEAGVRAPLPQLDARERAEIAGIVPELKRLRSQYQASVSHF